MHLAQYTVIALVRFPYSLSLRYLQCYRCDITSYLRCEHLQFNHYRNHLQI
jgi:hypothetical protein